jgi:membrane protein implicated in regulation of membrane protease activity
MTDPLSLVFLACIVFSGAFLVITTITGAGHTHGLHFGHFGHTGAHTGVHALHLHLGHAGHAAGHAGSHTASSTTHTANGATAPATGGPTLFSSIESAVEGALNVYGILIFLLIFGLLGFLLHNATNLAAALIVLIALLAGLAGAVVTSAFLARLFLMNVSVGLTSESSQFAGRLGQVSMTIREGGTGEVIFQGSTGARQSLGARSADGQPIASGTEIVILSAREGIATVQPWDRFMASARAGEVPQIETLDQE